jgi:hypothetical protein
MGYCFSQHAREIIRLASSTNAPAVEAQAWEDAKPLGLCAVSEALEASAASEPVVHREAVSFGAPMSCVIPIESGPPNDTAVQRRAREGA